MDKRITIEIIVIIVAVVAIGAYFGLANTFIPESSPLILSFLRVPLLLIFSTIQSNRQQVGMVRKRNIHSVKASSL